MNIEEKYKCKDCKDTKQIETCSMNVGLPYYDKELKMIVYQTFRSGDWEMTQCHCVGKIE